MCKSAATACEESSAGAQCKHVDGWVQYYEYFHKLNADMQQTSEASAQRRSCLDVSFTVKPMDSSCFDAIARSIETTDKHLVRIADGQGMTAENAVEGSRTLCEADLALVRAQLRAAAQSSTRLTQDLAEAQEELLAETAQDIETAVRNQMGSCCAVSPKARGADPGTCAAAIETLLWFGLALGEPPRSLQQLQILQQQEQHAVSPCYESPMAALSDLQAAFPENEDFDWEQAASEAGLDDEIEAPPPSPEVQSAPERSESLALCAKGSESLDSVATLPMERFDSGSSRGNSEGDSRAESICSDYNHDSLSDFGECPEEEATCESEMGEESLMACDMEESEESEERAAYDSPRESEVSTSEGDGEGGSPNASDRRCSRREARPRKSWTSQVEAPLLKWEKEQQLPRSKRRAAKRHAATAKRMEVEAHGTDTYETDSSEDLATQLGLSPKLLEPECFMLMADCAPVKRQRSMRVR